MAKTSNEIKNEWQIIASETQEDANTASRVGGAGINTITYIESISSGQVTLGTVANLAGLYAKADPVKGDRYIVTDQKNPANNLPYYYVYKGNSSGQTGNIPANWQNTGETIINADAATKADLATKADITNAQGTLVRTEDGTIPEVDLSGLAPKVNADGLKVVYSEDGEIPEQVVVPPMTVEVIPYNNTGGELNNINNAYFYKDASSLIDKTIYSIHANIQAIGDLLIVVGKNPTGTFVETSRQVIPVSKTGEQEIALKRLIKLSEGETIGFGSLTTRMFGLKTTAVNPIGGGYTWRQLTTGQNGSVNGDIGIGINIASVIDNASIIDISSITPSILTDLESAIALLPEKYYALNRLISFNIEREINVDVKTLIMPNYAIQGTGSIAANGGTDIVYMYPVYEGETITIKATSAFAPLIRTYAVKGMSNPYVRYLEDKTLKTTHTFTAQAGENYISFYTKLPANIVGTAFDVGSSIEITGGATESVVNRLYYQYIGKSVSKTDIQNVENWQTASFTGGSGGNTDADNGTKFNIDDFAGSDIEKINTAIEFVNLIGGGVVEITRDVLITESIIMRSNVSLTFTGLIKMANGVFDNIVRCYGVVPDPANPYAQCLELNETENIKLLGIGRYARIEHADIPYRAANPNTGVVQDWVRDYYGWRTISILMSNCKHYEIGNFFITQTPCWAISQEWGCQWGHVHDIEIDTVLVNRDCVNMRNGCRDILVERITGRAGDDVIACTALDNTVWNGTGYIYPLQTMGYEYKTGDEAGIFDITIRDITASGPYNIVDIVCTSPKIQRINIINISDAGTGTWVNTWDVVGMMASFGTGYKKGNVKDIRISNITCTRANYCVKASMDIEDSWFNNLKKIHGGIIYTVTEGSTNIRVTNS